MAYQLPAHPFSATSKHHSEEVKRTGLPFVTVVESVHWTEVRGRDTGVNTPLCLCPKCYAELASFPTWLPTSVAGVVLLFGGLLIYSGSGWYSFLGFCLLVAAPVGFFVLIRILSKRRGRRFAEVLRIVPIYRQILARYPHATVHFAMSPDWFRPTPEHLDEIADDRDTSC